MRISRVAGEMVFRESRAKRRLPVLVLALPLAFAACTSAPSPTDARDATAAEAPRDSAAAEPPSTKPDAALVPAPFLAADLDAGHDSAPASDAGAPKPKPTEVRLTPILGREIFEHSMGAVGTEVRLPPEAEAGVNRPPRTQPKP